MRTKARVNVGPTEREGKATGRRGKIKTKSDNLIQK